MEKQVLKSRHRFLPEDEDLRIVWVVAGCLSKRIARRDYERISVPEICTMLIEGGYRMSLTKYSIFLTGTVLIFNKQVRYLHSDLCKMIHRLNEDMKAATPLVSSCSGVTDARSLAAAHKVTLPEPLSSLYHAMADDLTIIPLPLTSINDPGCYIADTEFFSIDNPSVPCHSSSEDDQNGVYWSLDDSLMANQCDITLPPHDTSISSLVYSINEFQYNDPDVNDSYTFAPADSDGPIRDHNEPVATNVLDKGSAITPSTIASIQLNSLTPFVSPYESNEGMTECVCPLASVKRKSARRRLAFDDITTLNDKQLKNNAKSWKKTMKQCSKFPAVISSQQLLNTPCLSNVNDKLLELWKMNAKVPFKDEGHVINGNSGLDPHDDRITDISNIERMRASSETMTNSCLSYSAMSYSRQYTDASFSTASNGFSHAESSYSGARGINFCWGIDDHLSPVEESINEQGHDLKSSYIALPAGKESMLFTDLVKPPNNTRLAVSRTLMSVLESISRGYLAPPTQEQPYGNILLKAGNIKE